jgi:ParB-like nuclease domain
MAKSKIPQSINLDELPVHPAAAIFPMMTDDEIAEVAEDIKANGLVHPIVLGNWIDEEGEQHGLVDGRNRLRACQLAEVTPRFVELPDGQDAYAYIISVNIARRHLTKGQQAMAVAMVFPEPSKAHSRQRGLVSETKTSLDRLHVSATRLSQARAVLRGAPDLAALVLGGSKGLDAAIEEVRQRIASTNSEEERMARLHAEAPDLVSMVAEQRLTLTGAIAELEERQRLNRQILDEGRRAARDIAGQFTNHVINIYGALRAGEPDLVTDDMLVNIAEAYELLKRLGCGDVPDDGIPPKLQLTD